MVTRDLMLNSLYFGLPLLISALKIFKIFSHNCSFRNTLNSPICSKTMIRSSTSLAENKSNTRSFNVFVGLRFGKIEIIIIRTCFPPFANKYAFIRSATIFKVRSFGRLFLFLDITSKTFCLSRGLRIVKLERPSLKLINQ
eukprot:NODE_94_length_21525_cov_0.751003.p17 type:complete len:141 gc:universal NODE_94_length_21525_cov_0.751003:15628-15206(-)